MKIVWKWVDISQDCRGVLSDIDNLEWRRAIEFDIDRNRFESISETNKT